MTSDRPSTNDGRASCGEHTKSSSCEGRVRPSTSWYETKAILMDLPFAVSQNVSAGATKYRLFLNFHLQVHWNSLQTDRASLDECSRRLLNILDERNCFPVCDHAVRYHLIQQNSCVQTSSRCWILPKCRVPCGTFQQLATVPELC